MKISRRVRFFAGKFYNAAEFELKALQGFRFEIEKIKCFANSEKVCTRKLIFQVMLLREDNVLHLSCLFEKLHFQSELLRSARFWNQIIQRFRFWVRQFETCQKMKNVCFQKITFWTMLLRRSDIFWFFPAYSRRMILI